MKILNDSINLDEEPKYGEYPIYSYKNVSDEKMLFKFEDMMTRSHKDITKKYFNLLNQIPEVSESIWWKQYKYLDLPGNMDLINKTVTLKQIPDFIPNKIKYKVIEAFNNVCTHLQMEEI